MVGFDVDHVVRDNGDLVVNEHDYNEHIEIYGKEDFTHKVIRFLKLYGGQNGRVIVEDDFRHPLRIFTIK